MKKLDFKKLLYIEGEGDFELGKLVIVGEAPGLEEEKEGRPFIGKAGKLLRKTLDEVCPRWNESYYITNVIKIRPTTVEGKNRTPTDEENESWSYSLRNEVYQYNRKLILLLGNTAMKGFLGINVNPSDYRGKVVEENGYNVLSTYHPAAILRDPNKLEEWKKHLSLLNKYLG